MADRTEGSHPVTAFATGLAVVEHLAEAGPLGPTELGERLGYAKSTIHDYLQTLAQCGYAARNDDGTYSPTVKFLRLGNRTRSGSHLQRIAVPELERLADATDATTGLGVVTDTAVVYVEVVHADGSLRTQLRPGTTLPLHCTAPGKALLAASDRPERLLERIELTEYTTETITESTELLDRLTEIRQRGLATESEEFIPGIRGIASSVVTGERSPNAAVSVHTSANKLTGKQFHEAIPGQLIKTTNRIRNKLYTE